MLKDTWQDLALFLVLSSLIVCVDAAGLAGGSENNGQASRKDSMVREDVQVDAQGQPQVLSVPELKVDEENQ